LQANGFFARRAFWDGNHTVRLQNRRSATHPAFRAVSLARQAPLP